jgi:hypothetical protein
MKEQCTECGEYLIKTTGSTYCPNAGKHQHKKPQMMICPNRECTSPCPFKERHEIDSWCKYVRGKCPACIEYVEPSSPKDKHCLMGHTLPLDTDVSDQCRGGCGDYYPDDRGDCTNLRQALQPDPMPLRQQFEDACMYYGCCPYDALLDRLEVIAIARDQQVRKDLIEKVCKLLDDELRIISPNTEAKLKAHLRAMAEKE